MPPPEEGENAPDEDTPAADIAVSTPNERQTVLLWNAGNIPAYNEGYRHSSVGDAVQNGAFASFIIPCPIALPASDARL